MASWQVITGFHCQLPTAQPEALSRKRIHPQSSQPRSADAWDKTPGVFKKQHLLSPEHGSSLLDDPQSLTTCSMCWEWGNVMQAHDVWHILCGDWTDTSTEGPIHTQMITKLVLLCKELLARPPKPSWFYIPASLLCVCFPWLFLLALLGIGE